MDLGYERLRDSQSRSDLHLRKATIKQRANIPISVRHIADRRVVSHHLFQTGSEDGLGRNTPVCVDRSYVGHASRFIDGYGEPRNSKVGAEFADNVGHRRDTPGGCSSARNWESAFHGRAPVCDGRDTLLSRPSDQALSRHLGRDTSYSPKFCSRPRAARPLLA